MIKLKNLKQSLTGSPQPKLLSKFDLIENSENTNSTETMDFLKESLAPRTFNKISYAVVLIWFVISVIFFGIFAEVENTESRYDFRCGGTKSENIDLIRGECFENTRSNTTSTVFLSMASWSSISSLLELYVLSTPK